MSTADGQTAKPARSAFRSWLLRRYLYRVYRYLYRVCRYLYRVLCTPDVELEAHEAASTIFRFFRSKHVVDFKVIVYVTFGLMVLFIICVVIVGIEGFGPNRTTFLTDSGPKGAATPWGVELFKFIAFYIGSPIGAAGLILGWSYQSAAARLGVVDLFACEICTLCRVGTIMDVGTRYIDQYTKPPAERHSAPAAGSAIFVSQEDYFPILASNAKELQLLEALVVRNITEFYTYMKATRDMQRRLAGIDPKSEPETWSLAGSNVIYMLFLGFESARKAVEDLVEFEPVAAENKVMILLTELKCYAFLVKQFVNDPLRYERLKLRELDYRSEVPGLLQKVAFQNDDADWRRARRSLPELARRYNEAFPANPGDSLPAKGDDAASEPAGNKAAA